MILIKGEHWWREKNYMQIKEIKILTSVLIFLKKNLYFKRKLGFSEFFCTPPS